MIRFEHTRFDYFLLRTRHGSPEGVGPVRVTLEDLTSGDRWDFDSPQELARFIETGCGERVAEAPPTQADPRSLPAHGPPHA